VAVIGGGPAGMSAALWCADLGLTAVVFERDAEFGGQLLWTFNEVKNYLGLAAANGQEMRDRFLEHLQREQIERRVGAEVISVDLRQRALFLADGSQCSARALIIATGVRRRRLNIPGEAEFRGKGIIDSGSRAVAEVAGKRVAIIGGGDAALENALNLSQTAERVVIIHRRDQFTARSEFMDVATRSEKINFIVNTAVREIIGDTDVRSLSLEQLKTGQVQKIEADVVLIRIGVMPNSDLFDGQIEMDAAGYIFIDRFGATGIDRVFAAGDVANPRAPTIATACGMAATAAKSIRALLSS